MRILMDTFLLLLGDDFTIDASAPQVLTLADLSISPDWTLLFTMPAWTPNSALLWIHQRGSSHRIALMSRAAWKKEVTSHAAQTTVETHIMTRHPCSCSSLSLPKLPAEALVFPQPRLLLACPDPVSSVSDLSHFSLPPYTDQFTLPCSCFSAHTPQDTPVIGKMGVPQLQTPLLLETSKQFKQPYKHFC